MRTAVILFASLALGHAGELHRAARECDQDRMRQLLAQKASLNETDGDGMTPLHVAVDSRRRACVWLLLDAGADRNARDRQGRTPSDVAQKMAHTTDRAMFLYMLKNFSLEASQKPAEPAPLSLEYWVKRGHTDVAKMLLSLGADPNAIGTEGTTPLAEAALKGDLDGVRALLARGAQPNTTSQAGTQPIHDAALGDNGEVIRELVRQGADVNARTRDEGQTPLHIAAAMGKMKAVEALVALGADLTIKDSQGRTPLDTAARAGMTEVVGFLTRTQPDK